MRTVDVGGVTHEIVARGTNKRRKLNGVYFGTDVIDGKLYAVMWASFKTKQLEAFETSGPYETELDAQNAVKRMANERRDDLIKLGAKERWF